VTGKPNKNIPIEIQSLARVYTRKSIDVLGGYVTSDVVDPDVRIRAIGMILDRGWGKPAQPVTGKNGEEDIAVTIRTIIGEKK
jgi:hypothetical protein